MTSKNNRESVSGYHSDETKERKPVLTKFDNRIGGNKNVKSESKSKAWKVLDNDSDEGDKGRGKGFGRLF